MFKVTHHGIFVGDVPMSMNRVEPTWVERQEQEPDGLLNGFLCFHIVAQLSSVHFGTVVGALPLALQHSKLRWRKVLYNSSPAIDTQEKGEKRRGVVCCVWWNVTVRKNILSEKQVKAAGQQIAKAEEYGKVLFMWPDCACPQRHRLICTSVRESGRILKMLILWPFTGDTFILVSPKNKNFSN